MTESPRRGNLAGIAAAAGVSVPTVSKVLNGREGVSAATRERVQRAIAESGYQSAGARRARTTGRTLIDLVIGGAHNGYSMGVLGGILDFAHESNVDVVVSSTDPAQMHRADSEDWARRMVESGRRGVIAVTPHLTRHQHAAFAARGLPVVVVDPLNTPDADIPCVGSTNWAGGKSATEHLIALGHERIAFLGGPANAECNQARLHGYLASLAAHGIASRAEYVVDGNGFSQASGVLGAQLLLSLSEPPTAVFAANDAIALGVMEEARRRELRIPADLSVVGFDGTPLAEQTLPPLTSVAQPLHEIGRTALRTLVQLIGGERPGALRTELATELVVRGSTAAPSR